jgi:hypothetical protein
VRLTRNSGPPLLLTVDQQYVVVESTGARGPWKVSTRGYRYQLTDESERELAGWHWHPHGNSSEQKPHVHVYQDPLTGLHLPTGRVSVESVLRMLLTEFGVRPCRADWEVVLNATEAAFVEWRMWG